MVAPERLIAAIDKVLALPLVALTSPKGVAALRSLLPKLRARVEADSAWSAHSDELARKALTAAHDTVHRVTTGEITLQAADAALAAIIDTVSGLVAPDVFTTLNDTLRSLRT